MSGFAVGLLVDLALLQTLGLTSLIFTLIGYWAGRLREVRDPQAALTPLLVGAGATAVALVGYSLMEFMLGVDAPVSLDLLRTDRAGDARRRRRRAADVGTRAPGPAGSAAGGSAQAPAQARVHDRRAQPAVAGVAMERVRPSEPRTPVSPQLALRVAIIGGIAMVHVRRDLLPPLVPAGPLRRTVRPEANANPVRELPIPAPRGQILDRKGRRSTSRVTNAVQIVPSALPPEGPPGSCSTTGWGGCWG